MNENNSQQKISMTFGKASIIASVRAKIREVDVGDKKQSVIQLM